MSSYQGKAGLVTGAGSGMGRATALAFAQAGAAVVVADVNVKGGEETVALIREAGGRAIFRACDVSVAADVEALIAAVVSEFGVLSFAVNNAAVELEAGLPLTEVSEAVYDRLMAVNVKGVFLCLQQEIRQMALQGAGAIVNIASVNSYRPQLHQSVYTASKHAVLGLTRNAAVESASLGVRINAICPGAIETPMLDLALNQPGVVREDIIAYMSLNGRFGRPDEIAKAAVWLCSDDASFTYGHALAVDGGYLAR
ncbi:glucose 1-dehydrogenase [Noviherbaspirillum sedimenti]|uniref:Glucose 1-dehydrogenase n=1 Tax=Noviherbaspirillum sedimenti TaxID=2320865 RepID=A0A3A3G3V9_9BURK|nr:glucose 1-dehydrogenase [Noviherbaspirillum sedimenti]RJG03168.1 glucose 1-dehydrogenase [Noviherbaspirillum sedimenti]